MDLDTALDWARNRHNGVLVTLRRDGRPQTSDIAYGVRDGMARISVTADRAKTRNLERDQRAVLHVSDPGQWSYVSFDGTVELSAVAAQPGDEVCAELAELFRDVQGDEHPDWDEFNRAMVADQRLVVRFTPAGATGIIGPR